MNKFKILLSFLTMVNGTRSMDFSGMKYADNLVATHFSQTTLITQAESTGDSRLLLVFAENALDPKILCAGLYKIVVDTCTVDGHISGLKLCQFNLAEEVVDNAVKPTLDNIEMAKKLRLVSKEFQHMIAIKNIYALEREALKIKLLPLFVTFFADQQIAEMLTNEDQKTESKYVLFVSLLNYLKRVPLIKNVHLLNKHYSRTYEYKHYMQQLIHENEPNLRLKDVVKRLNIALRDVSTMFQELCPQNPFTMPHIYFETLSISLAIDITKMQ
ncbi:hypothetical protein IPH25_00310 [bacterium]|nr:MAG: hypothetical protein IPG37_02425 [bacterium]QQR61876.1 MAG: hypothetical protein IPH25_00310 [bacterium]QQR62539.1 MAG: hypothetical protein IPH67_03910 [bacterium]